MPWLNILRQIALTTCQIPHVVRNVPVKNGTSAPDNQLAFTLHLRKVKMTSMMPVLTYECPRYQKGDQP
jgi:hypothetical protein